MTLSVAVCAICHITSNTLHEKTEELLIFLGSGIVHLDLNWFLP